MLTLPLSKIKIAKGIGLLCAGLAAWPAQGAKDAEPVRYFQFKYAGNQPVDALLDYQAFLEKNAPGLDGLPHQYAAADALIGRGQYEEASRILRKLVDIPHADSFLKASILLKLADAQMHLGLYVPAGQFYNASINTGARAVIPEATIGLALAQVATADRELAYTRFKELVAFYPAYKNHPRYMFPLGLIQWEVRRYEGALEYFLRDEKNPASLYFAGLCYRAMKRIPEAIATFRRVTEEHPETPWAHRARFEVGETFYQQKDWPLASQTFTDIHRARPSAEWETLALYRQACTDFQLKNFKAAEEKFALLADENKDPSLLPNVTYLLSESLAEQKKVPRLIAILEDVQRSKRRSIDNTYRLIWAYTAMGDYSKAITLADEFLNANLDADLTPRALLVQGYAFEKQGKTPEAMASYQLVVERFPTTPYAAKAAQLAAMGYYRSGQYKAVTTQVKSLWSAVDDLTRNKYPETLFWMAQAHLKLRQSDQAQKLFQQFTRTAPPRHPWMAQALRAQALSSAMGKSPEAALPVLQRAYQNAQDLDDRELMTKLAMDMANISYNGKKYERAAGFYRQLEQIDPRSPQIPFALFQGGVALHKAEYYSDAIETWMKMVKLYPKDPRAPEALFRASKTHFDMAKYPEAVVGYQELIRNYPMSDYLKDAYIHMGQAYFNAKDYKKAIEVYREFLARFPRDPQGVQVSQLLDAARLKDGVPLAQIEAENKSGASKNPVLADAYWEEGAKYYNAKDYDKARELFEKLVYNFPNSTLAAQASFYRAEALFLQKKYPEAATAYTSFVEWSLIKTTLSGAWRFSTSR